MILTFIISLLSMCVICFVAGYQFAELRNEKKSKNVTINIKSLIDKSDFEAILNSQKIL